MQIKAKPSILAAVGLALLFTVLGIEIVGDYSKGESALPGRPGLLEGGNINESEDATWLEEYESNGVNGAEGVPAKVLPADAVVLAALLAIITAVLTTGVKEGKSDLAKPVSDESRRDWKSTIVNQTCIGHQWFLIPLVLAYGVVMLTLDAKPGFWSADPYPRYQAVALLNGHFSLADSIDAMQPGLAWHNGHVQQVWGLGVAFWLMPFQAIWRLLGGQVFPDRVALALAFALLAFYAANTGLRMAKEGHRGLGLGLIWLIVLCPPLWTLARDSQPVFEQTVLYGLLVSLGILVSVARVAWFDSRGDYWICCVLSVLAAWVRPTDGIYGLGAVLICSAIVLFRHRAVKLAASCGMVFLLSLILLSTTNWIRFGRPLEFGHRLTVSSGNMIYLTRFGNPFLQANPWSAVRELTGLLFLDSNVQDAYAYAEDQFPGQAPATRFRRLYLTAFDPSYALYGLAACAGLIFWIGPHRQINWQSLWQQPYAALNLTLLLWSSFAFIGLGLFYLYFPIIVSRYLLDFTPALIGLAAWVWVMIALRWGRFLWPLLGGWLLYEIATAKSAVQIPETVKGTISESALPRMNTTRLNQPGGVYTITQPPSDTGIPWNGNGWAQSGFAGDIVMLLVDKPKYVELEVDDREGSHGEPARKDDYRAMIDGISLPLRKVIPDDNGWQVTFDVPSELQQHTNDEILFVCFSKGYDAQDRDSERSLYSVRWR